MGILISDHYAEPIKLSLSNGLLGKLYRMVKRRNIYFDIAGEEVVEKPYTVICDEDKPCPAMDVNSRLKREQMDNISKPDLGPCENQYYKAYCIDPMPDSYWQWMKIYLFHYFLPPFPIFLNDLRGEVIILNVMWPIGTAIPPIKATIKRISKSFIFVLPRA